VNKVRVLLTPARKPMTGYTPVTGVTVKLTAGGRGTSAVTTTAQSAKLELLEIPGPGDATKTERVLWTVAGTIVDSGGTPLFDAGATSPTTAFNGSTSDFSVDLSFDSATVKVGFASPILFLPWESSAESFRLEVRARLTIAGTVEADVAQNDTLDLTMNHLAVPDDGTNAADKSDCVGISTVYPTKIDNLKGNQRIPFAGKTMAFFVEDTIRTRVNGITPSSYTIPALTTALGAIMTDAGFGAPTVTEFNRTTTAAAAALWTVVSGAVVASGVTNPAQVGPTAGATLPFFTFWVFADTTGNPTSGEAGDSEALNPFAPVSVTGGTKLVISPIVLFLRSTTPFANLLAATSAADTPSAVATVIAHEAGHGMGLRHGLSFNGSAGTYSKANGNGTMTNVTNTAGHVLAQPFGPVHKDVLKKFYL
jgi:hypothetical protein